MTLCYQTTRTYKVCDNFKIDLFWLHNYTNYTCHLVLSWPEFPKMPQHLQNTSIDDIDSIETFKLSWKCPKMFWQPLSTSEAIKRWLSILACFNTVGTHSQHKVLNIRLTCVSSETHNLQRVFHPRGSPFYRLYRDVPQQRVWFFLAILVWNRVWFVHSSLELDMFLRRISCFFIIWR